LGGGGFEVPPLASLINPLFASSQNFRCISLCARTIKNQISYKTQQTIFTTTSIRPTRTRKNDVININLVRLRERLVAAVVYVATSSYNYHQSLVLHYNVFATLIVR